MDAITLDRQVVELGVRAKAASHKLAMLSADVKNAALKAISDALLDRCSEIKSANQSDIVEGREKGLSEALLDRLTLNDSRIHSMADGLLDIAALPDPIGHVIDGSRRPNGLEIQRVRVPLGVLGIIYESRPNVTIDAAGLCIKSGNAVILRGGSEALRSNKALVQILTDAGASAGLPPDAVQLIENPDRFAAITLMRLEGLVDALIPRGGERLKNSVLENARVPVLTSLGGNCHTYIDADADIAMASDIAYNAKVSRPSVCNAMETLLVHADAAETLLPILFERYSSAKVEIRGCERTQAIYSDVKPAVEKDWDTEYLALILAVRVVDSLEEAIAHINQYGTGHSEAIVTNNYEAAQRFINEVDAACVYVNASTRFTDGSEFGMGAEVAISTQKLHARGPIGLNELTTYKTIIRGSGQIRL